MRFKLGFLAILLSISLFARKTDDAEVFFNARQFLKAKKVYDNYLKKKPNDALYNYRYGRCCFELKDFQSAIKHFELSRSKFPESDLYLGDLYFKIYRFDESAISYQTYLTGLDSIDSKRTELLKKLKKSVNAARLLNKTEDIVIADSVVVNKTNFLNYYKFSKELGTLTYEILTLSHNKKADKISYMTQRQDRKCFSDSIQGRMNIYTSYKLLDSWSKPSSISETINTFSNQNYPFFLLDGVTVYFASDNENSIGGYDIFVSRLNPSTNTYLTPENIGFPFNSPANDYMMVIDEQSKLGWFATDRNQPAGKVAIYTFIQTSAKNTVRTDNKDSLIAYAQLKIFRRLQKQKTDSIMYSQKIGSSQAIQFQFIINDSIVYSNPNQFKNPEALTLWNELNKLSNNYNAKQLELTELRTNYEKSEDTDFKKKLSSKIIDLENQQIESSKLMFAKTIEVRTLELKFLNLK